ncbi:hypothetical protein B0H10DRAFT_1945746 [Mycena sp. CBHHK59/15]|nr:hypothetical protein B0H10DRAFT_1945746 [Mycena sp. CBHHK59/15]
MSSSDQCAVGPDGQLLSPSRIPWYNDPDDKSPLPPIPSPAKEGRGHRKKDTKKLLQSLRMEHEDDDGNYIEVKSKRPRAAAPRPKSGPSAASKNSFDPLDVDDPEDVDFEADSSGVETSEVEEIISMAEVSDMLPSKTVPERSGRAGACPQLRRKDKKSARALGKRKQHSMSPDGTLSDSPAAAKTVKRSDRSRNPVYLFYKPMDLNRYGVPGDTGDKHFKCLHGSGKVIMVKKSQKYSVNGLVGHLSRKVPPMYRLYEILKDRKTPPTEVEILIASGKQRLDSATATQYLGKLEAASNSIITAFRKQQAPHCSNLAQ